MKKLHKFGQFRVPPRYRVNVFKFYADEGSDYVDLSRPWPECYKT